MNAPMKTKTSLLQLAGMFALIPASDGAEPSADAVLNASGIRHGLVVHVGATDGSLAEALTRNDSLLVQAIALIAATESQLRQRFVKAGVHGQATAGRIGTDITLPLADNVAAIVVADLDAAKAIKREELFRVLRPLGKAYLKSDGKWSATTKPRPKDVDDWAVFSRCRDERSLGGPRVRAGARFAMAGGTAGHA
jgi:hypothetical protein